MQPCRFMIAITARIGSRQQLVGGVPLGCPGGAQRSCGDHLHPIQLVFHGTLFFLKNRRFFSLCACAYVVDWPHVAQVRFWRPKGPHSETRHVVWQSSSSWDKKLFYFHFYGSNGGVLGQKRCLGVFWDRVRGSRPEAKKCNNHNGQLERHPIVSFTHI